MRYAYATFLMRGDGYLPGALVLGFALKQQSRYDCVCLVTDDVSYRAKRALELIYDKVILTDELRIKSRINKGRNDRNILMTRFQALQLWERYDKIVLLDADVLPVGGYDGLFSLPAPAGILMERKAECYSGASAVSAQWDWHKIYGKLCPHAARIPKAITDRVRYDKSNMGVNAGLWIIEPSLSEYRHVIDALNTPGIMALAETFPWPEMQLATLLWSGRWTNIDIAYCSIGGYPRLDVLRGIHFAGLKPWQISSRSAVHYAKFPDFTLWRQFFTAMYWSVPGLREYPALRRLWEFCK